MKQHEPWTPIIPLYLEHGLYTAYMKVGKEVPGSKVEIMAISSEGHTTTRTNTTTTATETSGDPWSVKLGFARQGKA